MTSCSDPGCEKHGDTMDPDCVDCCPQLQGRETSVAVTGPLECAADLQPMTPVAAAVLGERERLADPEFKCQECGGRLEFDRLVYCKRCRQPSTWTAARVPPQSEPAEPCNHPYVCIVDTPQRKAGQCRDCGQTLGDIAARLAALAQLSEPAAAVLGPHDRAMMLHATGGKRDGRNSYCTDACGDEAQTWRRLVGEGFAEEGASINDGRDAVFRVTAAGYDALYGAAVLGEREPHWKELQWGASLAAEQQNDKAARVPPQSEPAEPPPVQGRELHLAWNGTEWVDSRCGCRYHPDDDNGSHGGAPHVHRCERHAFAPSVSEGPPTEPGWYWARYKGQSNWQAVWKPDERVRVNANAHAFESCLFEFGPRIREPTPSESPEGDAPCE